ncbi:FAD-dependent monooxygenase [Gynuella sp.]|uniref:FAD-dependent monooxygenase n=1 Tax=Gynuella sp. TaxID=2969146 RepID=UPI003D10ECBC
MSAHTPQFDLVIIGGGLVGHALLAALTPLYSQGARIALLESTPEPDQQQVVGYSPAFDDRSTAISAGSIQMLQKWGLWTGLRDYAEAIRHIQISEKGGPATAELHAEDHQPALGYVIPNRALGTALLSQSRKLPVTLKFSTTVEQLQFLPEYVVLKTQQQEKMTARLVIIAEGGRSELKSRLGIQEQRLHFHQHAIIANVAHQQAHQNWAYERFSESGPLAMLPLTMQHNRSVSALVWSVDEQQVDELMALPASMFLARLQQQFGSRLGILNDISDRFNYPLVRTYTPEQVRSRLVLLGNSAVSLHPVAGQGLNLALRAVSSLAQTLIQQQPAQLGQLTPLLHYQQRIQQDQLWVMEFCDKLVQGFSLPGLKPVRALGLGVLDRHTVAKELFSRYAMGLAGSQLHENRL